MGPEKSSAVINHSHSEQVKVPCYIANLILITFYNHIIDHSAVCIYFNAESL